MRRDRRQHGARLHRAAGLAARPRRRPRAQGAGRHPVVAAHHLSRRSGGRSARSSAPWSRRCAGMNRHPAIFAYLIGNEIPPDMVRWHGPERGARVPEAPRRPGQGGRSRAPRQLRQFPVDRISHHRFHRFPLLQRLSPRRERVPPLCLAAAQSRGRPAAGADRVRHRFDARRRRGAGAHPVLADCAPPSRWASPAPSSSPGPTNGSPAAI